MTLDEAINGKEKIIEYNGNIFFLGGLDTYEKGEEDFVDRALRFYTEIQDQNAEKTVIIS